MLGRFPEDLENESSACFALESFRLDTQLAKLRRQAIRPLALSFTILEEFDKTLGSLRKTASNPSLIITIHLNWSVLSDMGWPSLSGYSIPDK